MTARPAHESEPAIPSLLPYLLLAFLCSLGVICVERGVYFYTAEILNFSKVLNLCLALLFGIFYIFGSLCSHPLAVKLGERRVLILVLTGEFVCHLILVRWPLTGVIFAVHASAAALFGLQWPIIESYISAGRHTQAMHRAVGAFNVSWASAVPLSLLLAGPLISYWPIALFLLPAALNLICLTILAAIPARPRHVPDDHHSRPQAEELCRLASLLASHRWLMLVSYISMFILAPLLPHILGDLGYPVKTATGLASLLDWMRVTAFVLMWRFGGWHGKRALVVIAAIGLPAGFFLTLFGTHTVIVLAGEITFGLAMGAIYYGALHYALLVKNASVDAGGAHEALIGAGFAIGPAVALLSLSLQPLTGSSFQGSLLVMGPILGAGLWLSLRRLPGPSGMA